MKRLVAVFLGLMLGSAVAAPAGDRAALKVARAAKIVRPVVAARGAGFVVVSGKQGKEPVVVVIAGGQVVELPGMLFEKIKVTVEPFAPDVVRLAVVSEWEQKLKEKPTAGMYNPDATREGSRNQTFHLVRTKPALELACTFPGDFEHWGPYPGSHRRDVEVRRLPGTTAFDVLIEEWHRQHEGQHEESTMHFELPATGACVSQTLAAPTQASKAELVAALRKVAGAVKDCGTSAPPADNGTQVKVKLVFQPSGIPTDIVVQPPYTDTPLAACVKTAVARARLGRFVGDPIALTFPFALR